MPACCTCRYCLCLFKIFVLINIGALALLTVVYVLFGNMPPTFTMAIGFWLLFYTNFFGIYVLLLASSVFYRNDDIRWINRLTQYGIVACIFLFALGGILYLIPPTAHSMMSFSKVYISLYGDIPPFLDTIQEKYKCCGINSYLDYGQRGFYSKDTKRGGYGSVGFDVYRIANPNDDFFHELIADVSLNRTVARRTTGLDIPQSCCPTIKARDPKEKDCGKKIEYTRANSTSPVHFHKQQLAAEHRVNDYTAGCFQKYDNIRISGYKLQLPYLIGVIQLICFMQCLMYIVALWFHRMALKTIRQLHFWVPELENLNDTQEMVMEYAAIEAEADEAHDEDEHLRVDKAREKRMRKANKTKPARSVTIAQ